MATNPENKNFLSPIGFQFAIQRLPNVNYFCTSASIPEISVGEVETQNPFIRLPTPGEKLAFGQLQLQFRVDEDLKNFQEIYDWLIGLGYPDEFQQRANVQANYGIFSDASLLITTNQYKPNVDVKFVDLYPTSLSAVEFNIEQGDVEYLNANVSFSYRRYILTSVA
jgi:hypothetical protein